MDRSETGKDANVIVGNQEIPVTNVEYSIENETAESDWNDEYNTRNSHVSGTASGSFEWDGSLPEARDAILNGDGRPVENLTLQINAAEEQVRFRRVKLQNFDRSFPGGDISDGTIEWVADRWRFPQ